MRRKYNSKKIIIRTCKIRTDQNCNACDKLLKSGESVTLKSNNRGGDREYYCLNCLKVEKGVNNES
jgi:hypothetical protein